MPTSNHLPLGVSEIRLRMAPDTPFEDFVEILRGTLTLPPVRPPGKDGLKPFKGCSPCMSGIQRFVLEDPAFAELQQGLPAGAATQQIIGRAR